MFDSLKKLTQNISLFKPSQVGSSVVGIDIGSSSIKVVQLKRKGGKAVLETYGALSLGTYAGVDVGQITNLDADKTAAALLDLIRESGVTTKQSSISIPSTASLIFTLELPAIIDDKQMATIIPTEARKYIPVPISEVSLDWWVIPKQEALVNPEAEQSDIPGLPKDKIEKNEVLVAAIHNDTISKYKEVATKVGVTAEFFEIEIFSSLRASLSHELGAVLLVDLGASKTKLSVIESGIIKTFHVINRGAHDLTQGLSTSLGIPYVDAEQLKRNIGLVGVGQDKSASDIMKLSIDYIFSETNNVILTYERKYNRTLSKIILSGGGALLKGILESAQGTFGSQVMYANPFNKVEAPAFLEKVLLSAGPEFAIATGLALRELQQ